MIDRVDISASVNILENCPKCGEIRVDIRDERVTHQNEAGAGTIGTLSWQI